MNNKSQAVGIVELSSVSKGYLVQDAMMKCSNIEKLIARTICSGKYLIVVRGDIASVEVSIDEAKEVGDYAIINSTCISNIDPQVFPALSGSVTLDELESNNIPAMLVLETFSVVTGLKAADFAAKEANLNLLRIHAAMALGGKAFVIITGELAALEAALIPAVEYCKEDGMLSDYVIIKNPHPDVLKELI